jgi:hypothetical protein
MKLYAQHGYGQGEKILRGLEKSYIHGVIYSPRDISAPQLRTNISEVLQANANADRFFDPQYFAAYNVTDSEARLGHLKLCEEYKKSYFTNRRRRELELDSKLITEDIEDCLAFQNTLDVTGVISPNILITRSFDSIEGAIAKNFIRIAGQVCVDQHFDKPLYATLAVSREALLDRGELFTFLEDITVLDKRPDGFYVLIAAGSEDARSDIFYTDVIAGWMLINHSLSLNGYQVINGYSDLLTPFLRIAGAMAGATGWWSNSRMFSLSRFLPASGGRLPIPRYLSKVLLNRISHIELAQITDLRSRFPRIPNVLNGLETDFLYPLKQGYEPARSDEVLQSWEAIRSLCEDICRENQIETLHLCRAAITRAINAYDEIQSNIRLDARSNGEHLIAIQEGLSLFARLAEMGESGTEPG